MKGLPPLHLDFDGELSPDEIRLVHEGLIDDFEWPVWLPDPQVIHKEAA